MLNSAKKTYKISLGFLAKSRLLVYYYIGLLNIG
jgi:hypothetical protein